MASTNLAVQTIQGLQLPNGVIVTPQHLHLPPGLPLEECKALLKHLRWLLEELEGARDSVLWYIADVLDYIEFSHGEKLEQAQAIFGKSESRLLTIQWTGRSFLPEERHLALSFRHHTEVGALPGPQRDELLRRAEDEGLSSDDLREERRKLTEGVKQYNRNEAVVALDRAATMVKALPIREWAKVIMNVLVKPLKYEAELREYRAFVRELLEILGRWRDVT